MRSRRSRKKPLVLLWTIIFGWLYYIKSYKGLQKGLFCYSCFLGFLSNHEKLKSFCQNLLGGKLTSLGTGLTRRTFRLHMAFARLKP